MLRGFVTAMRTLTAVPVPGRDAGSFADSLYFFPLAGALVGGVTAACAVAVARPCGWPEAAALLCVALPLLLTRALHVDGLADCFDALGAHDREKRLAIMKDPHVGTFGVVAVVVVLLARYCAALKIAQLGQLQWLVVAAAASRMVQVQLAVALPYARAGEGTARQFVEGARARHLVVAAVLGLLVCWAAGGVPGVGAVAVAAVAGLLMAAWMRRTFGGVTGDLLGTGSEVVETLLLFVPGVLAACAGRI